MAATPSPADLQAFFIDIEELRIRPGETARAYAAFKDYCVLGPGRAVRILWENYTAQKKAYDEQKKAARKRRKKTEKPTDSGAQLTLPPTATRRTLEDWCAVNEWIKRVRVYEDALGKLARSLEAKTLVEMNERHTNFALAMLNLAADRMQGATGDELTITELRLYVAEAIRLERQARGADNLELLTPAESAAGATVRSGRFKIVEIVKDYGEPKPATDE